MQDYTQKYGYLIMAIKNYNKNFLQTKLLIETLGGTNAPYPKKIRLVYNTLIYLALDPNPDQD